MDLVGKIIISAAAIYCGKYGIQHYPQYVYEIGIGVGATCALSLSY